MKKVAILQSNYIPWKGYFDLIAHVDVFVIYDEVQYTKQDWRNRNRIKTENGTKWISVPVTVNGLYEQKISETMLADPSWAVGHWDKLHNAYRNAPCFTSVSEWLKPLYLDSTETHLSSINRNFIDKICSVLGIDTKIVNSSDLDLIDGKTERLVDICQQVECDAYVSGPAAKSYLNEQSFISQGVHVDWFDYSHYPEYKQLWGDFDHYVSILDLLFSMGEDAPNYLKYVR